MVCIFTINLIPVGSKKHVIAEQDKIEGTVSANNSQKEVATGGKSAFLR